jgi:hypothetical protein
MNPLHSPMNPRSLAARSDAMPPLCRYLWFACGPEECDSAHILPERHYVTLLLGGQRLDDPRDQRLDTRTPPDVPLQLRNH